ncbi:MAG TPA: stage II sporulation protein M [Firmicutes bacterium]|jgi:stage II sporulation protein M|nr:stage II sporulation protein M [Bacillota bacterium]
MLKRFQRDLLEYIRENLGIYTVVTIFFLTGLLVGPILLGFLQDSQLTELGTAVSLFFEGLKNDSDIVLQPLELLKMSYRKNILLLIMLWLLGLLWMGSPFILLLLILKGFAIGFTVGFMVSHYSLKGVIFCLAALLPHNILLVPVYLAAGATAMTFSIIKIKDRLAKKRMDKSRYFQQYCTMMFALLVLILIGGLIEAYITPVFMELVVNII